MECSHCKKKFKSDKSKKRHIFRQICIPDKEKTYCRICNISCSGDKEAYKKHLLSVEHLQNISNLTTRPVEIQSNDIFSIDPFLSTEEKKSITGFNVVDNLTIKHKDNTISKVNVSEAIKKVQALKEKKKAEQEKKIAEENEKKRQEEQKKYLNGIHYISEPENKLDYESILNAELFTVPPKTERQTRILDFLVNCQNSTTMNDNDRKEKMKDILRLVNMDDANYLMSHIRKCDRLTVTGKQFFMNIIDKFIMELVKLINRGITKIGDKDIKLFVAKLSK